MTQAHVFIVYRPRWKSFSFGFNDKATMLSTIARVFVSNFKPSQSPPFRGKTQMEARPRCPQSAFSTSVSRSPPRGSLREENGGGTAIALPEWQGWGTESPFPERVAEIVHDLRSLEKDFDAQMSFGGIGGKLQVEGQNISISRFFCSPVVCSIV